MTAPGTAGAGTEVLVVGAGPTGLTLALALTRSGVAVRIVDRRAGTSRESRALDVQARTLELYGQLGVADLLVEAGVRVRRIGVRDGTRVVSEVDVSSFGEGLSPYPYILCCPQDDHEALLARALAAEGVRVEWESELTGLRHVDGGVAVTLTSPGGPVQDLVFPYVCGCDGARSTVREQLGTGFTGRTSGQRYFVADVRASGPTVRPSGEGLFSFCLGDEDFMLVVPARRGGTHRLIGLVPAPLAGRETVEFADLQVVAERTTHTSVESLGWFSTYRVSHRVADRFRDGRVFLLGDAGHVHSPLGGQGMNTGIADAVNLAWKLAAVVRHRAGESLLDTYEAERRPVARALVATTDRLFGLVAGPGRRQRVVRGVLLRTLLPALLARPVTRRALAARISQLAVTYRSGPLSRGRLGPLRGGDRLPWLPPGEGPDPYAALTALDWQVHVHGVAGPRLRAVTGARGLALHEFGWTAAAARAGYRRDAGYLVRPDGYLAAVARPGDVGPLEDVLDAYALRPRSP